MRGIGTLINVAAVLAGTLTGTLLGGRIDERARTTVLQAVGLVTVVLGVVSAARTRNIVFPLVAVVLGGLAGDAGGIEERLEGLGERIRRRVERDADAEVEGSVPAGRPLAGPEDQAVGATRSRFVEGFVVASLLFCVGPLAILGSIQDGLGGDPQLLVVKSALDGLVAVIFASTLGWGVGFSVVSIAVYQGSLTLAADAADRLLNPRMVVEMTATGGILIVGIGLRLLDLKQVRVGSLLPALLIAPVAVAVFAR